MQKENQPLRRDELPPAHMAQQAHIYYENLPAEEDEINLLDILITLLHHKFLIVGLMVLAGIGAVVFTAGREHVYRSEASIARKTQKPTTIQTELGPSQFNTLKDQQLVLGGSSSKVRIVSELKSRKLAQMVIQKYNLMPVLYSHAWDAEKNRWNGDVPEPTRQEGIAKLQGMLEVKTPRELRDIIKVSFVDTDPQMAKKVLDGYLTTLSNSMRAEVLQGIRENIRFLNEQLTHSQDPLMEEKIYALLAAQIEKETFAKAQRYFGFRIVDPPLMPEKPEPTHRKRDCLLAVVVAFFLAVMMAFLIEYVKDVREQQPDRYEKLIRELKFWKGSEN